MNIRAVAFGALSGLAVQLAAGVAMGVLTIHGNMDIVLAALAAAAIVSALVAGLVAAIRSGNKEIRNGIAAVLVIALASSINNMLSGSFNLTGLCIGTALAVGTGCIGAGLVRLTRHSNSSKDSQR